MEEFPDLGAFLEHVSLVMDVDNNEARRAGVDHDPAWRQGARIRDGFPARLGGGAVSPSALARRERPRRARGGAPPRLCRRDAGAAAGRKSCSPATAASTACGRPRFRRVSSTTCRQIMCNWSMTRRAAAATAPMRNRASPIMDTFGSTLRHAGLETGAAAPQGERGESRRPARAENHRGRVLASSTPAGKFAPGARIFHHQIRPRHGRGGRWRRS